MEHRPAMDSWALNLLKLLSRPFIERKLQKAQHDAPMEYKTAIRFLYFTIIKTVKTTVPRTRKTDGGRGQLPHSLPRDFVTCLTYDSATCKLTSK